MKTIKIDDFARKIMEAAWQKITEVSVTISVDEKNKHYACFKTPNSLMTIYITQEEAESVVLKTPPDKLTLTQAQILNIYNKVKICPSSAVVLQALEAELNTPVQIQREHQHNLAACNECDSILNSGMNAGKELGFAEGKSSLKTFDREEILQGYKDVYGGMAIDDVHTYRLLQYIIDHYQIPEKKSHCQICGHTDGHSPHGYFCNHVHCMCRHPWHEKISSE